MKGSVNILLLLSLSMANSDYCLLPDIIDGASANSREYYNIGDTISEEDLANSFRAQYEDFKTAYQEAAKPDFLDMDKDGNKKEPMKKAISDKK